jgi:hypothetical protein
MDFVSWAYVVSIDVLFIEYHLILKSDDSLFYEVHGAGSRAVYRMPSHVQIEREPVS